MRKKSFCGSSNVNNINNMFNNLLSNNKNNIISTNYLINSNDDSKLIDVKSNNNLKNKDKEDESDDIVNNYINKKSIYELLSSLNNKYKGDVINGEVFKNTPNRFVKAFDEMTNGYSIDVNKLINSALFDISSNYSEIVLVENINFSSLCEHHLLPFFGKVSIGYIPNKKLLGLSKFARLVEAFSKRLSLQERLCKQIADGLQNNLNAVGVAVYIEALHNCISLRGVKSIDVCTKTTYYTGIFKLDTNKKLEFLNMLKK